MTALLWNIIGMGKPARVRQLRELMLAEKVDIAGVQKTIKQTFTRQELDAISRGNFTLNWLPTCGHSGGILVGVKLDDKDDEDWFVSDFLIAVTIRERKINFRWVLMVVYGHAQHDLSTDFLTEMATRLSGQILLVVIGGDFSLIREPDDKSSMRADAGLMDSFNTFID